jgi:exonuclease III
MHTPGPWKAITHEATGGGDYILILAGSWDIAHNRHSARDWEEEKANSRLIAAAPELLEALKACLELLDANAEPEYDDTSHEIAISPAREMARAAIAKAEGTP